MQKNQEISSSKIPINRELAFQSFFDSAPMMMGVVELNENDILHITDNEAAVKFFGINPTGKLASELGMSQSVIKEWIKHYRASEVSGTPLNFEYQHSPDEILSVTVSSMGDSRFSYIAQDISPTITRVREELAFSEDKFRMVLDNMSEGLMLFDAGKNLIYQNPASEKIHGFNRHPGEIKSSNLFVTWKAWDNNDNPIEAHEWPVSRVFKGEIVQSQIMRVLRVETGEEFYGSYNGCPIYDTHGNLVLGFITIRDITQEIKSRQVLEESEEHYREIANTLPQIVWTATPDGLVDWYNDWWFSYLDLPRGTLWDDKIHNPMHPEDADRVWPIWNESLETGKTFVMEQRFRRGSDKMYRWHLVRANPIRNEKGNIIKWIGSNTDIHDHKILLDKLETEKELREKFVAALSHDLRTPLTAAKMSAQILTRKAGDEKFVHKTSVRIAENMDRADHLIQDMLDASKVNAGEKLPLELGECNLKELISETVEDLSTVHGDRFRIHAPEEIIGHWSCRGLRRIIENLCQNAIKYGYPHSQVTISVSQDEKITCIKVHNHGPEIPKEDVARLFEPYRRAQSEQVKSQKGWGLGLTLVKGLAEAHNGSVWLESKENEGTTFIVRIPNFTDTHVPQTDRRDN